MATDDPLVPLASVAELANVTEAQVRRWIRDGELAAEPIGDTWMVRTSVLEAASHEAGIPVRMALGQARMHRFGATQSGRVVPAARHVEPWKPAESLLSAAAIAELRLELETLWVPEPPRDHRARPTVEWPITATLATPVSRHKVSEAFGCSWDVGPCVYRYGLADDDTGWTFCDASDGPSAFRALEFGILLGDGEIAAEDLEPTRARIVERCRELGATSIRERYSLAEAVRRAEILRDLASSEADSMSQTLAVHAAAGYSAEAVVELVYAVGFQDAAGGTWAWRNREGCLGDRDIIAAAHDDPAEVRLSFHVARVAHPRSVARVALALARAVQGALGGTLAANGEPVLDETTWLDMIRALEARVRAAGLECGDTALLVL